MHTAAKHCYEHRCSGTVTFHWRAGGFWWGRDEESCQMKLLHWGLWPETSIVLLIKQVFTLRTLNVFSTSCFRQKQNNGRQYVSLSKSAKLSKLTCSMDGDSDELFEWTMESGVAVNSRRRRFWCCCSNRWAIDPFLASESRLTSVLNLRANTKLGEPSVIEFLVGRGETLPVWPLEVVVVAVSGAKVAN